MKKKKRSPSQHAPPELSRDEAFDALIEPYLDGALTAEEARGFEAHLDADSTARAQLALARRIRTALHALPEQPCPPRVDAAVAAYTEQAGRSRLSRLRRLTRTSRLTRPWRLPAWLAPRRLWQPALAFALLAIAVIGLWPAQPQPQVPAITAEEVRRAEEDVKLALAYLGEIGRNTGEAVGYDALESRVMAPVTRSLAGVLRPAQPDA